MKSLHILCNCPLCTILVVIGMSSCAESTSDPSVQGDVLSNTNHLSFDFGIARAGEVVEHVFNLRNPGSEPVRVIDVKTFCGCTAADILESIIPSNGQLGIPVRVDTSGKRGRISENVLVNLSNEDKRTCTLTGYVYNEQLRPMELNYSGNSKKDSATFYFDWPQTPDFHVLDTKYDPAFFSVSRQDIPDRRRSAFTIALLRPESYGVYISRITILTNDPLQREYFVPIEGYIPFPIEPETFSIAVGKLEPSQSKTVKTTISAPYGGQLEVTGVRYTQGIPGTWQIHRLGSGSVQLEFAVIVPEKPAHDAIITKIDVDAALPDYRRSFQIEAIGVLFDI